MLPLRRTRTGGTVFGFNRTLESTSGRTGVEAGERVRISAAGRQPPRAGALLRPAAGSAGPQGGRRRACSACGSSTSSSYGTEPGAGRRRRCDVDVEPAPRSEVSGERRRGRGRAARHPRPVGARRRRRRGSSTSCCLIAVTDFKLTYFGTVLGYVWSLARPLLLFGVLLAVFTPGLPARRRSVPHYPVLLLLNIVLFGSSRRRRPSAVHVGGQPARALVRKTQFPRLVIPLAVVLTDALQPRRSTSSSVIVFILAFGVDPTWTWLLFPVIVLLLLVLTMAVAMIALVALRALPRRRRSSGRVLGHGALLRRRRSSTRSTSCRRRCADCILLNPLTPIFEQARLWIIDPTAPGPGGGGRLRSLLRRRWRSSWRSARSAVWVFNREAPRIAEEL